jgi:hypothetical protein
MTGLPIVVNMSFKLYATSVVVMVLKGFEEEKELCQMVLINHHITELETGLQLHMT